MVVKTEKFVQDIEGIIENLKQNNVPDFYINNIIRKFRNDLIAAGDDFDKAFGSIANANDKNENYYSAISKLARDLHSNRLKYNGNKAPEYTSDPANGYTTDDRNADLGELDTLSLATLRVSIKSQQQSLEKRSFIGKRLREFVGNRLGRTFNKSPKTKVIDALTIALDKRKANEIQIYSGLGPISSNEYAELVCSPDKEFDKKLKTMKNFIEDADKPVKAKNKDAFASSEYIKQFDEEGQAFLNKTSVLNYWEVMDVVSQTREKYKPKERNNLAEGQELKNFKFVQKGKAPATVQQQYKKPDDPDRYIGDELLKAAEEKREKLRAEEKKREELELKLKAEAEAKAEEERKKEEARIKQKEAKKPSFVQRVTKSASRIHLPKRVKKELSGRSLDRLRVRLSGKVVEDVEKRASVIEIVR